TRAASKNDLGNELGRQLLFYPRAMTALTAMLGVMAFVPGLPMLPFFTLASGAGVLSYALRKHGPLLAASAEAARPPAPGKESKAPAAGPSASAEKLESLLALDALQIELGYGLVALADTRKGGDLLDRVTGVRRTFAADMGVIIPPIRLRDNLQLEANE